MGMEKTEDEPFVQLHGKKKKEREEKTIKLSPISCELRMSPVTEEPGLDAGGGTGDGNQMDMPKLLQTSCTQARASAKQLEMELGEAVETQHPLPGPGLPRKATSPAGTGPGSPNSGQLRLLSGQLLAEELFLRTP